MVATIPESKRLGSLLARIDRVSGARKAGDDSIEQTSNASTHPDCPSNSDNNRRQRISNILRDGIPILKKFNSLRTPMEPKTKHIFASDIVSEEFIEDIIEDKTIVSLEIEDLLLNERYRSLVSLLVDRLFCLSDREWKRISFVDSVAPEDFIMWRGHKHAVMGCFDYLESTAGHPLMEFRAILEFQPGTSIKIFLDALRSVNQHSLVQSVEFFGALFNCDKSKMTSKLDACFDKQGMLNTIVRIEVACGLEGNPEHFELLEMCLHKGREIVNKTTMDGSSQHSQSPLSPGKTRRRPRSHKQPRASRGTSNRECNALESPTRPNRTDRRRQQRVTTASSPTSVTELYNEDVGTKQLLRSHAAISHMPLMLPLSHGNNDGNRADRRQELRRLDGVLDLPTAFDGALKEGIPTVTCPDTSSPTRRRRAAIVLKPRERAVRRGNHYHPRRHPKKTEEQAKAQSKLAAQKHQDLEAKDKEAKQ